jgi:dTDP-4-dehydrorhamnose 3,5-epimerase
MIFTNGPVHGSYLIDLEPHGDERGFFARTYCEKEFAQHDLATRMVQTNMSYSAEKGTLRGIHYQKAPHEEAKLMRCTSGAIYDVMIDLRPDSPTYMEWMGVELTSEDRRMVYIPEGCAHGFLTLADHTEVSYQVSSFYTPGVERGIRFDDPAFDIDWPIDVRVVSEKDRSWPDVDPTTRAAVGS